MVLGRGSVGAFTCSPMRPGAGSDKIRYTAATLGFTVRTFLNASESTLDSLETVIMDVRRRFLRCTPCTPHLHPLCLVWVGR